MPCCCRCRKDGSGCLEPAKNASCCIRFTTTTLNALLFPVLWVYHALRAYLFPCVSAYLGGCCCLVLSKLCCTACFRYTDSAFPPVPESLGNLQARSIAMGKRHKPGCCRTPVTKGGDVEWRRGPEFLTCGNTRASRQGAGEAKPAANHHPLLVDNGIEPADIIQGQVGDCWLLSALACLAEVPGAVERVLVTKSFSRRGKYVVRLYDSHHKTFRSITVDDNFPVHRGTGQPLFAQPHGREIYVPVIEKAFAKMSGSFGALEQGHMLWALHALTGDEVLMFECQDSAGRSWRRLDMEAAPTAGHPRGVVFRAPPNQNYDHGTMFKIMKQYLDKHCVLGAGTRGEDTTTRTGRPASNASGLVPGHAYSVMRVVSHSSINLVQMRNPWGTFEWTGAWSDKSSEWAAHPSLASKCNHKDPQAADANDGAFWMSFDDFCRHFDQLNVCVLSRGVDDLALDYHEHLGCPGPCVGCVVGCLKYFCCCLGCRRLCCARKSSKSLVLSGVKTDGVHAGAGAGVGVSAV